MDNLQETIKRLITLAANNNSKQPQTRVSYNCDKCMDIGMVQTEHGYKECTCREIEKAKRFMVASGLKPDQRDLSVNTYKPYDTLTAQAKEQCKDYIKNFDSIQNNRENSMALLGQPGAGKTHLIVSIATNLISRTIHPVPVIYMPYLEAMQELKQIAFDEETYWKTISRYQKCKLLIIDDLFKDKVRKGQLLPKATITGEDMKHIYPIINQRYLNKLPTVYSSECTPEILIELDDALAGRILESCRGHLTVFNDKHNYRLRNFQEVSSWTTLTITKNMD